MAQAQQEVLYAIARARVASKRMVLAGHLADDIGVQIAFQAILHNLYVIGEVVRSIPPEARERVPDFPWGDYVAVADLIEPTYYTAVPAEVQGTVEAALDPLEAAMHRLTARR
jgi:uncharacterized protein with HEPN domain